MEVDQMKLKEIQYNNLLTKENHLKVAKAQYLLSVYDLWLKNEVDFEFFKNVLNE